MDFHLAIISTGRPHNVEFMQRMCEPYKCHWYVNTGESDEYLKAGAYRVTAVATNICEARNIALVDAFVRHNPLPCIQISDDLRNIKSISIDTEMGKRTRFETVADTCNELIHRLIENKLLYGGVAVSSNPLNYMGVDTSTDKLIVNDFICMMPCDYRFDETLALKEDYDMSIRHLIEVGGVLRMNDILCEFPHRQNAGGANSYRDEFTESVATALLIEKWPNFIRMNPRRPGQVLLNYKAIREFKSNKKNNLFDL